jgi:UDP-N-acetylmuramoyl-L-alanyl-D-glutamate--2,6-diaminopimelate ligase
LSFQNVTAAEIAGELNAEYIGETEKQVTSVTHDSRQAGTGSLFVAVHGLTMDGHRFVPDVMRRGAVGIIYELDALG